MISQSSRTILFGGPIFDVGIGGFTDGRMLVIDGPQISVVDSAANLPSGGADMRFIDVAGAFILPGLIDSHFHLLSRFTSAISDEVVTRGSIEGVINADRIVRTGVTTVRDPGCDHRGIYALKRAIAEGLIQGPRAFVSGPNPVGSGAPPEYRNLFADGPDQMRAVVRREWGAGADWIKLFVSQATPTSNWSVVVRYLNDAEIRVAVEEAHAKGIRVGGHVEGIEAARAGVEAGMDCIDHGTVIDDALAKRMASSGTHYVPTLWTYALETQLARARFGPDKADIYTEAVQARHQRSIEAAMDAGVLIGAGSDSIDFIPPQDVLIRELASLIQAGMSTPDAIRAATINGARILGRERELGSLDQGKQADILVVGDNPLKDVWALTRPLVVMKGGKTVIDLRHDHEAALRAWGEIASGLSPAPSVDRLAAFAREKR